MATSFVPFRFDSLHDAALLRAAGYKHSFVPADWVDEGGPENGPDLRGHDGYHVWSLSLRDEGIDHDIIVSNGCVVEAEWWPRNPFMHDDEPRADEPYSAYDGDAPYDGNNIHSNPAEACVRVG